MNTLEKMIEIIGKHHQTIGIAVETGTLEGTTTAILAKIFRTVHTIELSPELVSIAQKNCKAFANIEFHLGDSAEILPDLALRIKEPCLFYLDAHWYTRGRHQTPAAKESPFPLWKELGVLKSRKYSDIIVVDDVHAFGRKNSGWQSVSPKSLKKLAGGNIKKAITIKNHFVIYRG